MASTAKDLPYWLDAPRRHYGRLPGDERVDVAIVGGGVTGLSSARVLAEAGVRVRVLEARRAGTGASGRNGGFALRGTAAPYDEVPRADVMRLTEDALKRLARLAGDIFRQAGSLRVAASEDELVRVREEHDALARDGFSVQWVERDDLVPFLRPHVYGGIFHPPDGALEQGRWVRRLAELADAAGALLAEDTRVTRIDGTAAVTERGVVEADVLLVATDGYTAGLLPEIDSVLRIARGQVVATEPLSETYFECPVYARWGYDYWQQLPDRRLVIGGWRDTNLEGEFTAEERPTDLIQGRIDEFAAALLPESARVTHRWAGLQAFTHDLLPLVGPVAGRPGVHVSLGYSGHGNVLGFACGEAMASALLGHPEGRLAALSPERFPALRPHA